MFSTAASILSGFYYSSNILDIDKSLEFTPQFTMRLRDRRVEVSYPVRLTCQIAGYPEPTVKWFKDNEEITENGEKLNIYFVKFCNLL